MATNNGRKPLSQKKLARPAALSLEDIFGNSLGIDPELAATLKAKGLAWRFISYPQLQKMGGTHARGWKPYKPDSGKIDNHTFQVGADPEGFIRRGELILAVRPIELNEKHKQYLAQEAARTKGFQASKVEELREMVRDVPGMEVHEGYEDPNEEEENE